MSGRIRRSGRARARRDQDDPGGAERRALLARQLRAARATAGLTQEEAAHRAGMQTAVYSRIERGEVDPHISTVARVARALGVPVTHLVVGMDEL